MIESSAGLQRDDLTQQEAWGELSKRIHLVPSHSADKIAKARGMNVIPGVPSQPEWMGVICSHEIEVAEDAKEHYNLRATRQTDFKYAIPGQRITLEHGLECIIYFGGSKPGGETSNPPHRHEKSREHYFLLGGKAFMNGNEMGNYTVVPPNTPHHIRTHPEKGASFLILLEGVNDIPDDQIHIYTAP